MSTLSTSDGSDQNGHALGEGAISSAWDAKQTSLTATSLPNADELSLSPTEPDVDAGNEFDVTNSLHNRLIKVRAAANPLLEAARPLLRALADMPEKLTEREKVDALYLLLVREIVDFQTLCDTANLPWKHMTVVRYCICTALDESANRTEWAGGEWALKSLLVTFEGESDGGEKFFLLLGRLAGDPQQYGSVIEILLHILSLGFEGRYSVVADGRRHIDNLRQRLLTLLNSARDPLKPALSPHWQGESTGRMSLLRSLPVWTMASLLGLVLFGLFFWYKYHLLDKSVDIQRHIIAIAKQPLQPIQLLPKPSRVVPLRLSVLLKSEIKAGLVTVSDELERSIVTFQGDTMFVQGKSSVQKNIRPTLDKVATEIARVGGQVTIIGHTDSQRIHTAEFPDNQVLSEKRAAFVGQYLKMHGISADLIVTIGKGATEPIVGNATAAERARNRRVDIVVKQ